MKKIHGRVPIYLLMFAWAITAMAQEKCVIELPRETRTRLNATDSQAKEILKWYADGVTNMKKRPASDPTSWSYQANIHGTYDTPVKPLWNTCQHGSYFFLSWHRIYLYFFERIVRANSNPGFNLPYWDYDNPTSSTDPRLQLPPQFRDTSSSLYVADRNPTMNAGGYLPVGDVQTDYSMQRMQFTCGAANAGSSFGGGQIPAPSQFGGKYGALETLPHNAVHDDVGGLMGDPDTAAEDPIFWVHHSNIDRLWDAWLKLDKGRLNPPTSTYAAWWSQKFYFYDEKGKQCYLTAKDIENNAKQLGYKYQDTTVPLPSKTVSCPAKLLANPLAFAELTAANVTLSDKPVTQTVGIKAPPKAPSPRAAAQPRKFVLTLRDINFEKNPGVGYEIYIDLPSGETPDYKSPYYAGTLHFFELRHTKQIGHEAIREFDISDVVDNLEKQGKWKGDVTITYVPVGPQAGAAPEVHLVATPTIGKVSITEVQ